jgi:2-dehydropantoate 2-reductase
LRTLIAVRIVIFGAGAIVGVVGARGIEFETEAGDATERLHELRLGRVAGVERRGGSTWQSIVRGAGSVEAEILPA